MNERGNREGGTVTSIPKEGREVALSPASRTLSINKNLYPKFVEVEDRSQDKERGGASLKKKQQA